MYGSNPDQLDALAARFEAAADELDHLRVRVGSSLHTLGWHGSDGDAFRSQWSGLHQGKLLNAAVAIREAARGLRRNAAEQRSASAADGGGSSVGVGGAGGFVRIPGGVGVPGSVSLPLFLSGLVGTYHVAEFVHGGYEAAGFMRVLGNYQFPLSAQSVKEIAGAARVVGGAAGLVGSAFMVASVAEHLYRFTGSVAQGDVDGTLRHGAELLIDGASTNPYVAAGRFGWEAGWQTGKLIDHATGLSGTWSSSVCADHVSANYGSEGLSPSTAASLAHRYDGVVGFANFGVDTGSMLVHKLNPFD